MRSSSGRPASERSGFEFSATDRSELLNDLPNPVVAELEEAISKLRVIPSRDVTVAHAQDFVRRHSRLLAILEELDELPEPSLPEAFDSFWMAVRATVPSLIHYLKSEELDERGLRRLARGLRRRTNSGDRLLRTAVEWTVLEILEKHEIKSGGNRAARTLARVLRASVGVPPGTNPEAQKAALHRARDKVQKIRHQYPDLDVAGWLRYEATAPVPFRPPH